MSNSAISYARVSTNRQQEQGFSLAEQTNRNKNYAAANNLIVKFDITESCSGKKNTAHMNCLYDHSTHIIVSDISRFSRNLVIGLEQVNKFVKKNKILHFVKENLQINNKNYNNKLSEEYKLLYSTLVKTEEESNVIGDRIKNAKAYKKQIGAYAGGHIPFGLTTYTKTYIDSSGQYKTIKKFKWDCEAFNVIKFIEACRTTPFTADDLNYAMRKISDYTEPIELVHEYTNGWNYDEKIVKTNDKPLSDKDIAALLNDYEVKYRGKAFTSAIVKRIKTIQELQTHIVVEDDDDDVEQLENDFDNLNIPRSNVELYSNSASDFEISDSEIDDIEIIELSDSEINDIETDDIEIIELSDVEIAEENTNNLRRSNRVKKTESNYSKISKYPKRSKYSRN